MGIQPHLGRPDQPDGADPDFMQPSVQVLFPEVEKAPQDGKAGRKVVILPDIGL